MYHWNGAWPESAVVVVVVVIHEQMSNKFVGRFYAAPAPEL